MESIPYILPERARQVGKNARESGAWGERRPVFCFHENQRQDRILAFPLRRDLYPIIEHPSERSRVV